MKNLKLTFAAISLFVMAAACKRNVRHVIIGSSENGDYKFKIEYWGKTTFTSDGTRISSITPKGSAYYLNNDEEILAESDEHGAITYQVNDGPRVTELDSAGRRLLAKAIKLMIEKGHYYN